jgi:hypothetical protein
MRWPRHASSADAARTSKLERPPAPNDHRCVLAVLGHLRGQRHTHLLIEGK